MNYQMYKAANVYQERLNTFPIKESDYIEDCDYRFDDKEAVIEIFGENIVAAIHEELEDDRV